MDIGLSENLLGFQEFAQNKEGIQIMVSTIKRNDPGGLTIKEQSSQLQQIIVAAQQQIYEN